MYISQVSGERLQDHWSSGFKNIRAMLLIFYNHLTTVSSVGSSPALITCETSQILIVGSSGVFMPPTSEEVEGAYWFGSVCPVQSSGVCDA